MKENELTWKDVEDKIEQLGFTIDKKTVDGNFYLIDISDTLPYGIKESFLLRCNKDDPSSVVEAFHDILSDYNEDEFYLSHPLNLEEVMDKHGIEHLTMRLNDLLNQYQQWQETLTQAEDSLYLYVANASKQYNKEEIGQKFLDMYESSYGSGEEKFDGDIIYRMGSTITRTLKNLDCGTVASNKSTLSEFLMESGLTSESAQTCTDVMRNMFKTRNLTKSQINTVKEGMSEEDMKIHRMFDSLFNESETNPVKYAQFVLSAGRSETSLKGDRWWKAATINAVNARGILWQPTYERIKMLEAFGLIKTTDEQFISKCYEQYKSYIKVYGTKNDIVSREDFEQDIFTNKVDMTEYLQGNEKLLEIYRENGGKKDAILDKLFETADKKFGEYMFKYLKNLDVLDNKKKDVKISKQHGREGR